MSYLSAKRRRGYTLMELVVSMSSATLLMTGLASALVIATSSFNLDSGTQSKTATAAQVQADMMADLQHALSFSERTATAVTFTVPDRDNDTFPETIRYAWSGTLGDPLTYQYNGGTVVNIAEDVQSFDLSYLTRTMKPGCAVPTFEEFTEAKITSNEKSIAVGKPAGTLESDLLIAAIATDGDTDLDISAPSGWTLIGVDAFNDKVTLGVWWKLAGSSEPSSYTFDWSGGSDERAYGWIMRFTGHDEVDPIHDSALETADKSYSPTCPSVDTFQDDTLILRLGAFNKDNVSVDSPGLSGHTAITMDYTDIAGDAVSGGAGFETQSSPGSTGTSTFSLNDDDESVTMTVAIAGAGCSATAPSIPRYREFTEEELSSDEREIDITKPVGTVQGDLLIAAVATEKDNGSDITAPTGWTLIELDNYSDKVTLGVWWKIAGASEPSSYNFDWSGGENVHAYGWMMRFTGHDPTTPINASTIRVSDKAHNPISPAVTTTVDNALILRLGGFLDGKITVDQPGLSGHTAITMDGSDKIAGGAGYIVQSSSGSSGTSTFTQTDDKEYVTVTIAIAPAP